MSGVSCCGNSIYESKLIFAMIRNCMAALLLTGAMLTQGRAQPCTLLTQSSSASAAAVVIGAHISSDSTVAVPTGKS